MLDDGLSSSTQGANPLRRCHGGNSVIISTESHAATVVATPSSPRSSPPSRLPTPCQMLRGGVHAKARTATAKHISLRLHMRAHTHTPGRVCASTHAHTCITVPTFASTMNTPMKSQRGRAVVTFPSSPEDGLRSKLPGVDLWRCCQSLTRS